MTDILFEAEYNRFVEEIKEFRINAQRRRDAYNLWSVANSPIPDGISGSEYKREIEIRERFKEAFELDPFAHDLSDESTSEFIFEKVCSFPCEKEELQSIADKLSPTGLQAAILTWLNRTNIVSVRNFGTKYREGTEIEALIHVIRALEIRCALAAYWLIPVLIMKGLPEIVVTELVLARDQLRAGLNDSSIVPNVQSRISALYIKDVTPAPATVALPPLPPINQDVKVLLLGKDEILEHIDVSDSKWEYVLGLSKKRGGPIKVVKGGKATAGKDKLTAWWNAMLEEHEQTAFNRKPDLETFGYGREGISVPEISGHVKKRKERKVTKT